MASNPDSIPTPIDVPAPSPIDPAIPTPVDPPMGPGTAPEPSQPGPPGTQPLY